MNKSQISVFREARQSLVRLLTRSDLCELCVPYTMSNGRSLDGRLLSVGCYSLGVTRSTKRAIMFISGTHGPEFLAGHEMQMKLLHEYGNLFGGTDIGLILIHGLNPWGCEYGRRGDEGNTDFNRAFYNHNLDYLFDQTPYESYRSLVEPNEMNVDFAQQLLLAMRKNCRDVVQNVARGQYHSREGLFYGGASIPQVLLDFRSLCYELFSDLEQLAVIDVHTGVEGGAMLISPLADARCTHAERVRKWFGDKVIFPNAIGKTSLGYSGVQGDVVSGIARCLSKTEVTGVALEVGTIPFAESFPFLIAENWLHHHQQRAEEPEVQKALQVLKFTPDAFRRAFIPDDPIWRGLLEGAFFNTVRSALAGLKS